MTGRELRLRRRIDELVDRAERAEDAVALLRASLAEPPARERPRFRTCRWCGAPCYGRVCQLHRDVEQIEAALLRRRPESTAPASLHMG